MVVNTEPLHSTSNIGERFDGIEDRKIKDNLFSQNNAIILDPSVPILKDDPAFSKVFAMNSLEEYNNYISCHQNEPLRLFASPIVEKLLSQNHVVMVPITFAPVISYFLYIGLRDCNKNPLLFILLGFLIWTAIEYFLHSVIFHASPLDGTSLLARITRVLHFGSHGIHHKTPNDKLRLVLPLSVSITMAVILYKLMRNLLMLEEGEFAIAYASGTLGYVLYDCFHYFSHNGLGSWLMRIPLIRWQALYHLRHHVIDSANYGVTSPLWDYVFKTIEVKISD